MALTLRTRRTLSIWEGRVLEEESPNTSRTYEADDLIRSFRVLGEEKSLMLNPEARGCRPTRKFN